MAIHQNTIRVRYANIDGETLIVRDREGRKVLTDPTDESFIVMLRPGRRARLVDFSFHAKDAALGRHPLTKVFAQGHLVGFASVSNVSCAVLLQDLRDGQKVDVLPLSEPAAAYAVLLRPLPVLHGAVAVERIYAGLAA